jgi:SAM-dependent methyltransferase
VLICHNVLEHLECPLDDVRAVLHKVKPGGRAVFVILNQMPWEHYVPNDINRHLYTWNPMTLGTLLEVAGFVNIQVDVIRHMWPPNYLEVYERWGHRIFDLICQIRARRKQNYQIRAVAERA